MDTSLLTPANSTEQTILIVDDNQTNVGVIASYLKSHGFTILVARDGDSALNKAAEAQPDIILMDIVMPGKDGYDTCLELKSHEATKDIPVIFMTALSDTEHKVKGFSVGAVDYVTKPLQRQEVLARVTTHLKIQELTLNLRRANEELAKLNASKDRFFSILAHDLRGSFLPLLSGSQLLSLNVSAMTQDRIRELSETIYLSAEHVLELLENLLRWGRLQLKHAEIRPKQFDLAPVIARNVGLLRPNAQNKQITLANQVNTPAQVYADEYMMDTVIRNLMANAVKFTPQGGKITVSAQEKTGFLQISVVDTGIGMNKEQLETLFDIGSIQTTMGTHNEPGTGLGLIMCRDMINQCGGEILVESEVGKGTAVTFTVPDTHQ